MSRLVQGPDAVSVTCGDAATPINTVRGRDRLQEGCNVRLLNVQDLMLLLDTVAVVSSSIERILHKTFPRIVVDLQFQVALD